MQIRFICFIIFDFECKDNGNAFIGWDELTILDKIR